jgi:threonine synthase
VETGPTENVLRYLMRHWLRSDYEGILRWPGVPSWDAVASGEATLFIAIHRGIHVEKTAAITRYTNILKKFLSGGCKQMDSLILRFEST